MHDVWRSWTWSQRKISNSVLFVTFVIRLTKKCEIVNTICIFNVLISRRNYRIWQKSAPTVNFQFGTNEKPPFRAFSLLGLFISAHFFHANAEPFLKIQLTASILNLPQLIYYSLMSNRATFSGFPNMPHNTYSGPFHFHFSRRVDGSYIFMLQITMFSAASAGQLPPPCSLQFHDSLESEAPSFAVWCAAEIRAEISHVALSEYHKRSIIPTHDHTCQWHHLELRRSATLLPFLALT